MPYVSDRQRRYFHAQRAKLEAAGVDVAEWDDASRGLDLPETAPRKKKRDTIMKTAELLALSAEAWQAESRQLHARNELRQKLAAITSLPAVTGGLPSTAAAGMSPLGSAPWNQGLLEKLKSGLGSGKDQALSWLNSNPEATLALGGAAGGAILGGGASLLGPRKKRRVLSDAVTGGLAGGAMGLGAGLAARGLGLGSTITGIGDKLQGLATPSASAQEPNPADKAFAKAETPEAVEKLYRDLSPPEPGLGAGLGDAAGKGLSAGWSGVKSVGSAAAASPAAAVVGGASLGASAQAAGKRYAIRSGRNTPRTRGELASPLTGLSVNTTDEASAALRKALRIVDEKQQIAALRKLLPADIVGKLNDAQLGEYATKLQQNLDTELAARSGQSATATRGANQVRRVAAQPISVSTGAKPAKPRAGVMSPPATATKPIDSAANRAAIAHVGAHAAPTGAYDLPGASHFPRVNKYWRSTGTKAVPALAAIYAMLQEKSRLDAEAAQRQSQILGTGGG